MGEFQQQKNFEAAMTELEEVVNKLETGDCTLDEALKQFENGVELVRYLNKKLEQAETTIKKLVEEEQGDFSLENFPDNQSL